MKRREMVGMVALGMAALAQGNLLPVKPAAADHRLGPLVHRLDTAIKALLEELTGSAHHQDGNHEANDEVLAILAAGALCGQVSTLHKLMQAGDVDAGLRVAVRELLRQLASAERRILHAHVTRDVRRRFQAVQALLDELASQAGIRLGTGRFDR
jgi:hypothetical protein